MLKLQQPNHPRLGIHRLDDDVAYHIIYFGVCFSYCVVTIDSLTLRNISFTAFSYVPYPTLPYTTISATASATTPASSAAKKDKKDGNASTSKTDGSHANDGTNTNTDEAQTEADLEDMSKDQLRLLILPYLAGDLFAIWRETDIAAEREKRRQRRKLLGKGELTLFGESEEDIVPYTAEELAENKILADLSPEDRVEYEKNKREQVVYTMLQDKYGLEEDQIYNEEDQKRFQANLLQHKIRPARGGFLDPM